MNDAPHMTHPKPDLAALKEIAVDFLKSYKFVQRAPTGDHICGCASCQTAVRALTALLADVTGELAGKAEAAIAERDEAVSELDQMNGVHERAQLAERDLTDTRAERDALNVLLKLRTDDLLSAAAERDRLQAELAAIKSAITDPENQPSQYGTVTLAWHEAEIAGARERVGEAASDVLAERERQRSDEGWTFKHDDKQSRGELGDAAASYALSPRHSPERRELIPTYWPWSEHWWKPKDRRRDLVKAGALILAEIERLDRDARLLQPKKGE